MTYMTVRQDAVFEYEEKKSRFIGRIFYTPTEEAAKSVLTSVRAGDPEARHHVYAYVIREGGAVRMSDDGEPAGTGGAPVLNVIRRNGLEDVTVTVTRYFGGILLGAGGLTRAYAKAAAGAADIGGKTETAEFVSFSVSVPYPKLNSVLYLTEKSGAEVQTRIFAENVSLALTAEAPVFAVLKDQLSSDFGLSPTETGRYMSRK